MPSARYSSRNGEGRTHPAAAPLPPGRLCSSGARFSRSRGSPSSSLLFGSPSSESSSTAALVLPRSSVYLSLIACSFPPAQAFGSALRAGGFIPGRPPALPQELLGSPRSRGLPFASRRCHTPRQVQPARTHFRSDRRCLHAGERAGHSRWQHFRGCHAPAHSLACPRFASVVTGPSARLDLRLVGFHLVRAGLSPAEATPCGCSRYRIA